MNTILIQNGTVLTMDEEYTVHSSGWVWVEADRIQAVGAGQPPVGLAARAGRIIEAAQMAVLPGLVNGHTHLSQTFMRGLGDDKPLLDWLKQVMWPIEAVIRPEDMRLASLLGLVENLRCGVTGLVQHHKIVASPAYVEATLEAAQTVGSRLHLARGWVDLGDTGQSLEVIVAEMARLRQQWPDRAGSRITVGFGPLAAWRCSDAAIRHTVALAREWGLTSHIHVAEARAEIELMRQRNGLSHIEWLHSLDALGPETQLVHCVHVSDDELDLIAAGGAMVVHCPVSNMYLASGVAPVPKMLERGITVALGSDGPASHNSQDLLETMKIAALLAKVHTGDATALLPRDVLRMVTTNGARLLGRADLGQLKPGFKADITLVDLNNARSMPVHRPDSALVYNASGPDAQTVIVDGQVLLDAGRVTVLDEPALLAECRTAAARLLERAGVVL